MILYVSGFGITLLDNFSECSQMVRALGRHEPCIWYENFIGHMCCATVEGLLGYLYQEPARIENKGTKAT